MEILLVDLFHACRIFLAFFLEKTFKGNKLPFYTETNNDLMHTYSGKGKGVNRNFRQISLGGLSNSYFHTIWILQQ